MLATTVSEHGKLMAYRSDYVGDENYKLTFQTLPGEGKAREFLPESGEIEQVSTYCFHELPGSKDPPVGVFYAVRNQQVLRVSVSGLGFSMFISLARGGCVFNEVGDGAINPTEGDTIGTDHHHTLVPRSKHTQFTPPSLSLYRDGKQRTGQKKKKFLNPSDFIIYFSSRPSHLHRIGVRPLVTPLLNTHGEFAQSHMRTLQPLRFVCEALHLHGRAVVRTHNRALVKPLGPLPPLAPRHHTALPWVFVAQKSRGHPQPANLPDRGNHNFWGKPHPYVL